jgi:hypothetical protein
MEFIQKLLLVLFQLYLWRLFISKVRLINLTDLLILLIHLIERLDLMLLGLL